MIASSLSVRVRSRTVSWASSRLLRYLGMKAAAVERVRDGAGATTSESREREDESEGEKGQKTARGHARTPDRDHRRAQRQRRTIRRASLNA